MAEERVLKRPASLKGTIIAQSPDYSLFTPRTMAKGIISADRQH
jgi:hypothetical protein